jgi:hypothetical protein
VQIHGGGVPFESLSVVDYLLGLADFTGELMRSCLNAVADGNTTYPFEVAPVLRSLQLGCSQRLHIIHLCRVPISCGRGQGNAQENHDDQQFHGQS